MNADFKLIAEGYLYSPWNGTLREYKGEVHYWESYVGFNGLVVPERSYFIMHDERGKILKKIMCSSVEGIY